MAHTLKIIKVTPADVESDVADLGAYLNEYIPSSLSLEQVMSDPEATITETANYYCDKATIALIETEINDIEYAFAMSRYHYNSGAGDRYYVKFQTDGGSKIWRSEITDGRVKYDKKAMDAEWITKMVTVYVIWTRRAFWEENSETELELSNINQAVPATGGVQVDNHDDAAEDNYVDIAAAQVVGVLPSPARITMKNDTGGALGYRDFYIGHSVYEPSNFTHVIEGESFTGLSNQVDANSSAGNFGRDALGSSYSSYNIDITGAQLDYAAGRYFRVLGRLATGLQFADVYVKLYIRYSSTLIWEGDAVNVIPNAAAGMDLMDLGIIQLPPALAGRTGFATLNLRMDAKCASGGNFDLDFIQLTPLDSYQHLQQTASYSLDNNAYVVDDGIYDDSYAIDTAGDLYPLYVPHGDHIYLHPDKAQRVIFLIQRSNGDVTIADTIDVRVYYRPRVITI